MFANVVEEIFLVGIGGFWGALSRYGINSATKLFWHYPFPISTLIVNLLGCFVAGYLTGTFKDHLQNHAQLLFLSVGFLGSFTTFSAWSYETISLFRATDSSTAILNILLNVIFSLVVTWLGVLLSN